MLEWAFRDAFTFETLLLEVTPINSLVHHVGLWCIITLTCHQCPIRGIGICSGPRKTVVHVLPDSLVHTKQAIHGISFQKTRWNVSGCVALIWM